MAQQQKEQVYWDVLTHEGRSYYIAVTNKGVVEITLGRETLEDLAQNVSKRMQNHELIHSEEHVAEYKKELVEYFSGQRQVFGMALDLRGTEFQKKVWQAIYEVPFGVTCSYQDLAQAVGNPKAVRAVGTATGRNPVPIVVPCHRVIASNGTLGGFSGGLPVKIALLKLEGIMIV